MTNPLSEPIGEVDNWLIHYIEDLKDQMIDNRNQIEQLKGRNIELENHIKVLTVVINKFWPRK